MTAIRLLITDPKQKRWRALEEQLRHDPGFECVGRVSKLLELLLAIRTTEADAVVFFAETEEPGILSHVFAEYPDLIVLTLCPSGEAYIEERCPARWTIVDSPLTDIVEVLRNAVIRSCDGTNYRDLQLN